MTNKLISSTFQNTETGQMFTVFAENSAPPEVNPDLYDANGWGITMKHDCAVACRAVDEQLALMAGGDQFDQSVAEDYQNVLFAVFLPDRAYPEEVKRLINRNRQQSGAAFTLTSGYLGRMTFLKFYPAAVRDSQTRKVTWGDADPQVLTPVMGFDPYDDYQTLADEFVRKLVNDAQGRRSTAALGAGAPGFSPRPKG